MHSSLLSAKPSLQLHELSFNSLFKLSLQDKQLFSSKLEQVTHFEKHDSHSLLVFSAYPSLQIQSFPLFTLLRSSKQVVQSDDYEPWQLVHVSEHCLQTKSDLSS